MLCDLCKRISKRWRITFHIKIIQNDRVKITFYAMANVAVAATAAADGGGCGDGWRWPAQYR